MNVLYDQLCLVVPDESRNNSKRGHTAPELWGHVAHLRAWGHFVSVPRDGANGHCPSAGIERAGQESGGALLDANLWGLRHPESTGSWEEGKYPESTTQLSKEKGIWRTPQLSSWGVSEDAPWGVSANPFLFLHQFNFLVFKAFHTPTPPISSPPSLETILLNLILAVYLKLMNECSCQVKEHHCGISLILLLRWELVLLYVCWGFCFDSCFLYT